MNCTRCGLSKISHKTVIGRGDINKARFLFLSETPGFASETLGKAFVGEDALLVFKILERLNIDIEDCFFISIVLCRASDIKNGITRDPTAEEIFACIPNIERTIKLMDIQAVIFMGPVAEKYYKKRFTGIPWVTITAPSLLAKKGGLCCSLTLDNINKLERFFDDNRTL
jgi:uracil-DNA glycosylase family 4